MDVYNELKNARKLNGYSLDAVQTILKNVYNIEIDKSNISRYENKKVKNMDAKILKALCKIYKINYIDIFEKLDFLDKNFNFIETIQIPVFESVSAGCGRIPNPVPIDYISLPVVNSSNCVAIKVEGESMEPTLSPGDLIILKKETEVKIGDIGVFLDKNTGESFVKRLKNKNGNYILESDNKKFKNISLKNNDIICCGRVINVIKKL